jgi:glycerate kinase
VRILVAPDKFKGTATAQQAARALADGLTAAGHSVHCCPLADGGEGTLEALGGANRTTTVTGPLGDPVSARWRLSGRSAVIEMAQASGLQLVGGAAGNDAVAASTYGTGELIATAVEAGARSVLVGVGGSATTDGGLGALRAMYPVQRYRGVDLEVACDVRLRFVDAARVFAAQKGATDAQVRLLEGRLERLVQVYREDHGVDVAELEGGGAAGGLAGGLACAGATLRSGFEVVAEHLGLDELVEGVDLVVTGEGFLDAESFDGKVVGGVMGLCAELGVPVVAVVGECIDGAGATVDAELRVVSLVESHGRDAALGDVQGALRSSAQLVLDAARRDA